MSFNLSSSLSLLIVLFFTTIIPSTVFAKPNNIIFIVSDGMGYSYTSAYRAYKDNPATNKVENTIFDQLLTGTASTYSQTTIDFTGSVQGKISRLSYVTDSAAAATALATGEKTYNGAIATDPSGRPLLTLMQEAKRNEKVTAAIVTSQINHATPASFIAHNQDRRSYNLIANDFYDNRIKGHFIADLLLGGGVEYFQREDRDLVQQFIRSGYLYLSDLKQLPQLNRLPALGLFAPKGLPHSIDAEIKTPLTNMVKKALPLLKKYTSKKDQQGFFLLIEASQVDWCGHALDIACAMVEMDDLAQTTTIVKNFIDENPDTLLVMTADHATGGLSLGADHVYAWKPELLKRIRHSTKVLAEKLMDYKDSSLFSQQELGLVFDTKQLQRLTSAKQQDLSTRQDIITQLINEVSHTGWTTKGHDGTDVPVFSYGHGQTQFVGFMDNTDIAKKLFSFL